MALHQLQVNHLARGVLGLDPDLIAIVTPYLPYQGQAAYNFVRKNPLTLTQDQVARMDKVVEDDNNARIAAKYDAISTVGRFNTLPPRTQTAIADVFYQYGTKNPAKAAPNFFSQVTSGDWAGAYKNLQDFGDDYASRRRDEAALLQQDIEAGLLPVPRPRRTVPGSP